MSYLARGEKHRYLLAWAFVLLSCVLGVRYGYGNDFYTYEYYFNHGELDSGNTENIEPCWALLNKLFKPFGFPSFVFFMTAIEHLMIFDLIRRHVHANYYWFAVFLYVFNPNYMLIGLSMMRQFLVQILGLYALEKAIDKKYIQFFLIVSLAFTIHKVAIFLLLLYLLPFIKRPKWWIFIGVFFIMYFIISNMMLIIEQGIGLIQESGMKYADSYLNDQVLGDDNKLGLKTVLHYFVFIVFFIRGLKFLEKKEMPFSWMVVCGILIIPFALAFPMAIRTSWIYTMAEILCFPLLLQNEKSPILKYGLSFILITSILLFEYRGFWGSEIYGAYFRSFTTIFSNYSI